MNDIATMNILDSLDEVIEEGRTLRDVESFAFGGGEFQVSDDGVTFVETSKDGKEIPRWLCSRLDVVAKTRDAKSGDWGRQLCWQDPDGHSHTWAMPVALLQGDGAEVRRELASKGVQIAVGRRERDFLSAYILNWPTDARVRCVKRLGWYGSTYVLPNKVFGGTKDEVVVWQGESALEHGFSTSGSVDDWASNVAALAIGNSRPTLAISCAFAASLLDLAGLEGGGVGFVGGTSCGKSTCLEAGSSTFGKPREYLREWAATTNGLEGIASLHNDGLLVLDEIKRANAHEVGDAAYLLANGTGKSRAKTTGDARSVAKWRLLFLSAGEKTMAEIMGSVGKKPHAGMEIRLAEITADAGCGYGAFETVHHYANSQDLSNAIKAAASKYYGTVGQAWIERVVKNRVEWTKVLRQAVDTFVTDVVPEGASGQVARVAARFGLIGCAGELATDEGLTGWESGWPMEAAVTCFQTWLEGFGGAAPKESREALIQIRSFIEQHSASRFEDMEATDNVRVINSVGFFRQVAAGREYLIYANQFKNVVCAGISHKVAEGAMLEAGWISLTSDNRPTHRVRVNHLEESPRFYILKPAMWASEL